MLNDTLDEMDLIDIFKKLHPNADEYTFVSSAFLVDSIYMGLVFCIHSTSLCLLVGAFNPFTFKAIIDIYVPVWG